MSSMQPYQNNALNNAQNNRGNRNYQLYGNPDKSSNSQVSKGRGGYHTKSNSDVPPPDIPLGPLDDQHKFFLANMAYALTAQEVKQWFSQFGIVNHVKIIYDKSGHSKGYGFLYMHTHEGARAVDQFAASQNNMISMLGRTNVHCARHDARKAENKRINHFDKQQSGRYPNRANVGGSGGRQNTFNSGLQNKAIGSNSTFSISTSSFSRPEAPTNNTSTYLNDGLQLQHHHHQQQQQQQHYSQQISQYGAAPTVLTPNTEPTLLQAQPGNVHQSQQNVITYVPRDNIIQQQQQTQQNYQQPVTNQYTQSQIATLSSIPVKNHYSQFQPQQQVTNHSYNSSLGSNIQTNIVPNVVSSENQSHYSQSQSDTYNISQPNGYIGQQQLQVQHSLTSSPLPINVITNPSQHGNQIQQHNLESSYPTHQQSVLQKDSNQYSQVIQPQPQPQPQQQPQVIVQQQPINPSNISILTQPSPSVASINQNSNFVVVPNQGLQPKIGSQIPQTTIALPTSKFVFIENLPTNTQIPHLIDYFSMAHNINVMNASMEYDPNPKNDWCYSHIEFYSIADAATIIQKANVDNLIFKGRHLMASTDLNPPNSQPQIGSAEPIIGYNNNSGHIDVSTQPSDPRRQSHSTNFRNSIHGGTRGRGARGRYYSKHRENRRDRPY